MRSDWRRRVGRARERGEAVRPEERLRVAVLGTWAVPVSLYWACVLLSRLSLSASSDER